jgi:hypothetical protein
MDFAALVRRATTDGLDPHLLPPPLATPAPHDRLVVAAMAMAEAATSGEAIDLDLLATRIGVQIADAHRSFPQTLVALVARLPGAGHDLLLLSPRCPNPRAALATGIAIALLRTERPVPVPLPFGLPGAHLIAAFALDLLLPPGALAALRAQGLDAAAAARRLRAPLSLVAQRMAAG